MLKYRPLYSGWKSYLHAMYVPQACSRILQQLLFNRPRSFLFLVHFRFQIDIQSPSWIAMPSDPSDSQAVDIHASRAPQIYAAAITSYFLAVVAVALRFWARRLMKANIWVDDWSIAGALV